MPKEYRKVGLDLEVTDTVTTVKIEMVSMEHIEINITALEKELAYWNNLKSEADKAGVTLTEDI